METQELNEKLEELDRCPIFVMFLQMKAELNEMKEKMEKLEDLGYFQS